MTVWRWLSAACIASLLASCNEGFDIKQVDESVVRVQHVVLYQGQTLLPGHGTGFVLNDEGYVVTNNHVVRGIKQLPQGVDHRIIVPDRGWSRKSWREARVVWSSESLDLAVIHVPGLKRRPVTLSAVKHTVSPEKGDTVYAIGFPGAADLGKRALESTFTPGAVGKVGRGRGPKGADRPIVQHNADISPGNSGGPLFNECNHVVGVNTFVATSKFVVQKDARGRIFARGAAVSGVYYSPHVVSLINALTTEPTLRKVKFSSTSTVCVKPSGIQPEIYILIAVVFILAVASMVLALVRKRGSREVIKVVETYSQWIRRRGGQPSAAAGAAAGAAAATATAQTGKRRPSSRAPDEPPPELDEGWVLAGFDSDGKTVRLVIGQSELARASKGADKGLIIGRSNSLSNKVLGDGSVSRRHARIVVMNEGLGLEDLNSTYGTEVDGTALKPYNTVELKVGSKVKLGDVTLELSKN